MNAIGKSRMFQLVLVERSDSLCFGMVGRKCFCRSNGCKVKFHSKKSGWDAMRDGSLPPRAKC
jgi:hypothetical protein